jgi:formylglycine-generating enzyme required for sulfatase activity
MTIRNHIIYGIAFLAALLLQVHPILAQGSNNRKSYEPEMVFVQGGTFQMGIESVIIDERPVHSVTLSDYYIGKYEVTQSQWREVMGTNRSLHSDCDQCPEEQVSWDDAQVFIEKLNAMTGRQYRLPTEAEWEFSARGGREGKGYVYSGSNDLNEVGYFYENANDETHTAGKKRPNELGIFDMSGNVWEWCSDWYGSYVSQPVLNPQGASTGDLRVLRGGSWNDNARYCQVSSRYRNIPSGRFYGYGFRLVLSSSSSGK